MPMAKPAELAALAMPWRLPPPKNIDDGLRRMGSTKISTVRRRSGRSVRGSLLEIETHFARRFIFHDFFSGGPTSASTQRATVPTSEPFADEHAGAFRAGDGPLVARCARARAPGADGIFTILKRSIVS